MSDIIYKWQSETAVGMDEKMMLPQFKVVGHFQRSQEVPLSTGKYIPETQDVNLASYSISSFFTLEHLRRA